jgi:hypothetical protein
MPKMDTGHLNTEHLDWKVESTILSGIALTPETSFVLNWFISDNRLKTNQPLQCKANVQLVDLENMSSQIQRSVEPPPWFRQKDSPLTPTFGRTTRASRARDGSCTTRGRTRESSPRRTASPGPSDSDRDVTDSDRAG